MQYFISINCSVQICNIYFKDNNGTSKPVLMHTDIWDWDSNSGLFYLHSVAWVCSCF